MILDIFAILTSHNTYLELEYLSENLPVYCLDIYLSVYERISRRNYYFLVKKFIENQILALSKQGKNY